MLKRGFDLLVSLIVMPICIPLMLGIALAIVLESGRPVFYVTERAGKNGNPFKLYGFRTMMKQAVSTTESHTFVGRFIRAISLDHLPYLFNILKGDLSIVGPRPHEVHQVNMSDPLWQKVLSVKPGLISWSILRYATSYNRTPIQERNLLEANYVDRQSLRFDLYVLAYGIWCLMSSRGNVKAHGTLDSACERVVED